MTDSIYPEKYAKQISAAAELSKPWGDLVAKAYESVMRDELRYYEAMRKLLAEEQERRRQEHLAWWAQQTLWTKVKYLTKQGCRRARRWTVVHWDRSRFWLSNLIYKHEECDY